MSYTCHVDQTTWNSEEELHSHLRKLKISQENYYTKIFQRKDKFTGEPIPYKDKKNYFSTEFLSKENMRKWIEANPEEGKIWALNWLKNRKEEKKLIFAPSQVELRSLMCPSIHYYNRIGNYENICKDLGLLLRFTEKWKNLPDKKEIIIQDTREQNPISFFDVKIEKKALNYGDYALPSNLDQGIYIERKSLNDFVGTLSSRIVAKKNGEDSNLLRFARELERAKECSSYIVMIVESSIDEALSFDKNQEFSRIKVNPSHIFKNLRDLLAKFDNFQVLFVKNRLEMRNAIKDILFNDPNRVKKTDLQLAYEKGEIILS